MERKELLDPFFFIGKILINWHKIAAGAVICAIASLAWTYMNGETFQSTATLVLLPPPFKATQAEGSDEVAGMIPKAMQVVDYQVLLSSDSVLYQVKKAMDVYADTPEGFSLRTLHKHLRVVMQTTNMGQRGPRHSPVITLVAKAKTPELAAEFANTWADVALKTVADTTVKAKRGSLTFLENEYKNVKDALTKAEDNLQTTQDSYDTKIATFTDETDKLVTSFKIETQNMLDDLTDQWDKKISELQARLALKRKQEESAVLLKKLSEFEDELILVHKKKSDLDEDIKQLGVELAKHPELQVVAKAITDDALWQRVVGSDNGVSGLPKKLDNIKLRTEQINPVYEELSSRLASTRVEFMSLPIQEKYLTDRIESIRQEHDKLLGETFDISFQIDEATRQKTVDLANLTSERTRGESQITRDRKKDLAILKRESDLAVERLQREVTNQRAKFDALAGKYLSAKLAEADNTTDIVQSGVAVPPQYPISGGSKLMPTIVGGFVGILIGLVFVAFEVLVREILPMVINTRPERA